METIFVEEFDSIPWRSSKEFLSITKPGQFHSGPVGEEYFTKWQFKVLRKDSRTEGVTRVLVHSPGWDEPNFGYHLYTEEAIRIVGEGKIPDEAYSGGIQYNISKAMSYTYRPPGWVHDGSSLTESTFLIINDGPATHLVVPEEMVGKNALYPNDLGKAIGPRGYIRRLETTLMPWLPIKSSPKIGFLNHHPNVEKLHYKPLSADVLTRAETILVKHDPGYHDDSAGLASGEVELFVLDGSLTIGNKKLGKYGYAYLPKGYPIGTIESSGGSVSFIKDSSGTWFHS